MKYIKRLIKNIIFYRQYQRLKTIYSYYSKIIKNAYTWIFAKTETDNFYYSITEKNLSDLISIVSIVTGKSIDDIEHFIEEINTNTEIFERIKNSWLSESGMEDAKVGLARRVGWYAVIRSSKPKLIVETGVSHGVGALVICAALEKNASEGYPGRYIGTDINLTSGKLLLDRHKSFAQILIGDSLNSLKNIEDPIDLFINDSDHSAEYEGQEYRTIQHLLSLNSIILGDNSHVTEELRNFSYATGRRYIFFSEKPSNHWYPGAGIGFSFR